MPIGRKGITNYVPTRSTAAVGVIAQNDNALAGAGVFQGIQGIPPGLVAPTPIALYYEVEGPPTPNALYYQVESAPTVLGLTFNP